jgi:hypothetical protein
MHRMGCTKRPRLPLGAILAVAARQHGLVTRSQLLDAGLSRGGIEHRLRNGRIYRVYPAVFALGRPELTREGVWLAAVLACDEGAALSHRSGGELWGIYAGVRPRWPEVSAPTNDGRPGPGGIKLHRAPTLQADDITEREAVPVTTLPRTLLDLASTLDAKRLRSALRQAERLHKLDLPRLRASLDALSKTSYRGARLKRALDAYVPGAAGTEGEPEAAFLELCAKHGLPPPQTQVEIGPYRVDFMWPELRLVVEIDDRGSHDGHIAFQEDRVRDRTLTAAGVDVLRFTRNEVSRRPTATAREVAAAVARLRSR